MANKVQALPMGSIRIDGGTQPRERIDEAIVAEYRADMERGDKFPPMTVFFDGVAYWLADGFHRYHAARGAGKKNLLSVVHEGTVRDARLHAVGANGAHGFRRSNADKRAAVLMLLEDAEWGRWSDRELARRSCTSGMFVGTVRASLAANVYRGTASEAAILGSESEEEHGSKPQENEAPPAIENSVRTYTDRHGNTSQMDTSRIGRRAVEVAPADDDGIDWGPPPAPAAVSSGICPLCTGKSVVSSARLRYEEQVRLYARAAELLEPYGAPEESLTVTLSCVVGRLQELEQELRALGQGPVTAGPVYDDPWAEEDAEEPVSPTLRGMKIAGAAVKAQFKSEAPEAEPEPEEEVYRPSGLLQAAVPVPPPAPAVQRTSLDFMGAHEEAAKRQKAGAGEIVQQQKSGPKPGRGRGKPGEAAADGPVFDARTGMPVYGAGGYRASVKE